MIKEYCSSCGGATEYTLTKPIRCCMCGELLDKKTSNSKIENKPFIQTPARVIGEKQIEYGEDEDGRYEIVNSVPQIDKLDVNIDIRGSDNRKTTLRQLRPDLADKMSKPSTKKGRKKK